jgi:hypothetical protein
MLLYRTYENFSRYLLTTTVDMQCYVVQLVELVYRECTLNDAKILETRPDMELITKRQMSCI